jgi:uncharacterized protein YndB with AHSA1/START domain
MTTPDVPYRFEHSFEVPGTPEQVWAAIATANGISSWMLVTDLEEREGGAVTFHMGPEAASHGEVTAFDAPKRFAYEEPEWAALAGHPDAPVTPMATEFIVEAASGGTCVVRVVSSAFGTGADWEQEFWEGAFSGWTPMLDVLRLYLTHFPGQQVTPMEASTTLSRSYQDVMSAMQVALGGGQVGAPADARGATGTLELLGEHHLVVRLTDPVAGFLTFVAHQDGDSTWAMILGHLFSSDAGNWVKREQPGWQAWLEELVR